MDFRATAWEETIGQASEDWKSLHQICRRLTKAPAPVYPLLDKTGMHRYATKDRRIKGAKILAEHLEEQFTSHPALQWDIADEDFAGCWKIGRVIGIPKAGKDPRIASSQRPITLLSHIAKLFERIVLRRLHRHLIPRQEQSGFCSGHSTTLQLAQILHLMAAEHNRRRRTVGIFLYIEKAFDRVWHFGLLFKLISIEIPPALVRTVASFLDGCNFYVTVEESTSEPRPIRTEDDVVLAIYADDSVYLISSRRADLAVAKFQRVLDLLPNWLDKWRVAVNVTKTASLLTG
ncbi:RNA-directed DNA polymerase from mobile element jockey [Eumeta japonica]|uniref:RNA-directed DNA polymerase from mobile element jockey n=1 Tax=Eumeta variegata TaxID=151549 RepID=A0A4C1WPK6_EUMVA|nr:RNA-directed DNA polymerase from mobile element jockey [Eumeta japonica]